jgi:hypothetical protein
MWAVGALAEGFGMRAVARVFAVAPNTVLTWLVHVAEHAATFLRVKSGFVCPILPILLI